MAAAQEMTMKNCPHHQKIMAEKASKQGCTEDKNCCSNKTVHIQSDQDQQTQIFDFVVSSQLQHFVAAYVAIFLNHTVFFEKEAIVFAHYKPPIIQQDILVLNQTFLL